MNVTIRHPHITSKTEEGQLRQIRSYLYQLVEELNWALTTLNDITDEKPKTSVGQESGESGTCNWIDIGLSDAVSSGDNTKGRYAGCGYLLCDDVRHVHIAFNCAVSAPGSVIVNASPIPEVYRPKCDIYAACIAEGDAVVAVKVGVGGYETMTCAASVNWVDGYIDYWID